ncbi:hypothetical protein D3C87_1260600 [compost metagenome]
MVQPPAAVGVPPVTTLLMYVPAMLVASGIPSAAPLALLGQVPPYENVSITAGFCPDARLSPSANCERAT